MDFILLVIHWHIVRTLFLQYQCNKTESAYAAK